MAHTKDRFIYGHGGVNRTYVIHTHKPRFIAEIHGGEGSAMSGDKMILRGSNLVLTVDWIDPSQGVDLKSLEVQVEAFLEQFDEPENPDPVVTR